MKPKNKNNNYKQYIELAEKIINIIKIIVK